MGDTAGRGGAEHPGSSTPRARCGTPRRPACGGWTSPGNGCTAPTRRRATTAPGPPAGQPGGVVLDAAGEPVVASPEGLAVLDRSTGTMDLRVPVEQDRTENRANDVKTDDRGRAWVGTMAFDKRPRNAALYRVDGGKATCVVDGLTICNGPAFDEPHGPPLPRRHGPVRRRRIRPGPRDGRAHWPSAFPRLRRGAGLAGRHDRRRRGHAMGRAGTGRSRPPLPRRRHARRRGRATGDEPHLGGLRRHRGRRSVHHDLVVRLRTRQPRRPAAGRGDLPLPARGDRAPLTAVRGRPGVAGARP